MPETSTATRTTCKMDPLSEPAPTSSVTSSTASNLSSSSSSSMNTSTVNNFNNCNYFILHSQSLSNDACGNANGGADIPNGAISNGELQHQQQSDLSSFYGCSNDIKTADLIKSNAVNFYYNTTSAGYPSIMTGNSINSIGLVDVGGSAEHFVSNKPQQQQQHHQSMMMMGLANSTMIFLLVLTKEDKIT